jgi:hypothetical protein
VERESREKLKEKKLGIERFVEDRKKRRKPIQEGLHARLETHAGSVPETGKLGEAIRYALREWHTLERYVDDW